MTSVTRALGLALPLALFLAGSGCATSARFYSKTGRKFTPVVEQAVVCNEQEADVVARGGGEPIGSIAARGLASGVTEEDVVEKAARVAAASGGTHVVLTERGVETFEFVHPETHERECTRSEDRVDCRTIERPATVTTVEHPTAKFVVLRVPPERWGALPEALRPAVEN